MRLKATQRVSIFVAAIVKGLVESDDATKHFGSTSNFNIYWKEAENFGFVEFKVEKRVVTPLGLEWYKQQNLQELSEGRANHWTRKNFNC